MATAPPDKGHQPMVVTLPQYVTTEVQAQPHMVVHQNVVNIAAVQPRDDIIWSLVCFAYGNPFCLGLAALIFSVKVENLKAVHPDYGNRVQALLNKYNAEAKKNTNVRVYSRPGAAAIAASSKM